MRPDPDPYVTEFHELVEELQQRIARVKAMPQTTVANPREVTGWHDTERNALYPVREVTNREELSLLLKAQDRINAELLYKIDGLQKEIEELKKK